MTAAAYNKNLDHDFHLYVVTNDHNCVAIISPRILYCQTAPRQKEQKGLFGMMTRS